MKNLILINFVIVIILILSIEAIIRLFNFVGMQGYDTNAFYLENEITFIKPSSNFKVFGKKSKSDQFGFRIPVKNFSYDDNKQYTLIIGDSVTFGVGVEEKDSFVGILRKKYKKENLLNSAIFGYNIKSYLYVLKKNKEKFNKKINNVIIFLCLNDIVPYQGVVSSKNLNYNKTNNKIKEKIFHNSIAINLNLFLREKSATFVLLKGLLLKPKERHYNLMRKLYDNQKNLNEFEKYLSQILQFTAKNNLSTKFVLLPYAYQINNNCRDELLAPQNEIIKIFKNLNLELNNYTENFCNKSDKNNLFLKYDPVHLSKYGHEFVSDLLMDDKTLY